jgi:hypothetical protein
MVMLHLFLDFIVHRYQQALQYFMRAQPIVPPNVTSYASIL